MNSFGRYRPLPEPRRRKYSTTTLFVTSFFLAPQLFAQPSEDLVFYPTEVEAILDLDYTDRTNNSGRTKERAWDFGARINQEAFYLDPGIARFRLDIEPVVSNNHYESGSTTSEQDGEILNYLLQADLLRDTPGAFAFDFNAQKSTEQETGSLGSRYDSERDSVQALASWKNSAFPMSLSIERESLDQEFESTPGATVSERDEVAESWSLSGRSSKLSLRIDHLDQDDRIVSRDNDFVQDQANLLHQLEWGKASSLTSRINSYERTGFNANERVSWAETVRIQHTDQLFSRTSYQNNSIKQNIEFEENILKLQLNHRLYQNLTTNATLDFEDNESDIQEETINGIDIHSRYQKQDFFGASVNAGLGAGYQDTERDTSNGAIDVIDESHVVPLNSAIILGNRFIIISSIVVTDNTGAVTYTIGTDYNVNSVGGDQTEIQVVPGGPINSGDTLLVSYQATALPTQDFSTTNLRYSLGANFDWFRFSHSDRKIDNKLRSGADQIYLNDSRYTTTDIEFRGNLEEIELSFDAQRDFSSSAGFDTTTYTYRQMLAWQTSPQARLNVSLTESFIEQSIRETDIYSLRTSIDWRPRPRLTIRPVVVIWNRKDKDTASSDERDDDFLNLGVTLNWQYRKVSMKLDYRHNEREVDTGQFNTSSDSEEDRILFRLSRRFY